MHGSRANAMLVVGRTVDGDANVHLEQRTITRHQDVGAPFQREVNEDLIAAVPAAR